MSDALFWGIGQGSAHLPQDGQHFRACVRATATWRLRTTPDGDKNLSAEAVVLCPERYGHSERAGCTRDRTPATRLVASLRCRPGSFQCLQYKGRVPNLDNVVLFQGSGFADPVIVDNGAILAAKVPDEELLILDRELAVQAGDL